jgi:hypothetical protein
MTRRLGALACVLLSAGCVIFARPMVAPDNDRATVMVLSTRLGGPVRRIARHAYLAVRAKGQAEWTIWECCSPGSHGSSNPFIPSFGDEVRLHGVFRGAKAEKMIACLPEATRKYGNPSYVFYPGPNSNTYVDAVMRECDIHTELPSTSVGKDHRGLIGVSWTSGGTGVQVETPLVGLKIGLTEGIELHVLSLSIGVDLWPPAIIVPLGEGRVGFADR